MRFLVRSAPRVLLLGAVLSVIVAGCGGESLGPEAQRGKQTYLAQCTACHAFDPAQDGAVGPAVKGSSRDLLEAKVLRGTYPPGHRPKRRTSAMPPQPQLAAEIPALAEFLK